MYTSEGSVIGTSKGKLSRKGGKEVRKSKVELAGDRPRGKDIEGTMIRTRQKFYST
jgi:hypothetical protein